jgi:hypothetical protein
MEPSPDMWKFLMSGGIRWRTRKIALIGNGLAGTVCQETPRWTR